MSHRRLLRWALAAAIVVGLSLSDRPSGATGSVGGGPDGPFPQDYGRSSATPVTVAGHRCWFVATLALVRTEGYDDTLDASTTTYGDYQEPDPAACAANIRVILDYSTPAGHFTVDRRKLAAQSIAGSNSVDAFVGDQRDLSNISSFSRAYFPACDCHVSARFHLDVPGTK